MRSQREQQYHPHRGENWFLEGKNLISMICSPLKLNPTNKKSLFLNTIFSCHGEIKLKKILEWGGDNEKN